MSKSKIGTKGHKGYHMIILSDSTSKSSRVRLMSFSLSFSKHGSVKQ